MAQPKKRLSEFPLPLQIRAQRAWIASAGNTLEGYIKTFGDRDLAAQHWEQDVAELNALIAKQNRKGA